MLKSMCSLLGDKKDKDSLLVLEYYPLDSVEGDIGVVEEDTVIVVVEEGTEVAEVEVDTEVVGVVEGTVIVQVEVDTEVVEEGIGVVEMVEEDNGIAEVEEDIAVAEAEGDMTAEVEGDIEPVEVLEDIAVVEAVEDTELAEVDTEPVEVLEDTEVVEEGIGVVEVEEDTAVAEAEVDTVMVEVEEDIEPVEAVEGTVAAEEGTEVVKGDTVMFEAEDTAVPETYKAGIENVSDLQNNWVHLDMVVVEQVELHSVEQLQYMQDWLVNTCQWEQEDKMVQFQRDTEDQVAYGEDMKEQVLGKDLRANLY